MAVATARCAQIFKLCFLILNSLSLEWRAQSRSRFSGKSQRRQTAPGDDFGFGELCADAKTARLFSASLLYDDASNLSHLPAYAIDHDHTVHQLEGAEYCHPTKIEIISEIGYGLCRKLGDYPFVRAEE